MICVRETVPDAVVERAKADAMTVSTGKRLQPRGIDRESKITVADSERGQAVHTRHMRYGGRRQPDGQ